MDMMDGFRQKASKIILSIFAILEVVELETLLKKLQKQQE